MESFSQEYFRWFAEFKRCRIDKKHTIINKIFLNDRKLKQRKIADTIISIDRVHY